MRDKLEGLLEKWDRLSRCLHDEESAGWNIKQRTDFCWQEMTSEVERIRALEQQQASAQKMERETPETDAVDSGRTALSLDKTPLEAMRLHARSLERRLAEAQRELAGLGKDYEKLLRESQAMERDRDARAREACSFEKRTTCSFAVSASAECEELRAEVERLNGILTGDPGFVKAMVEDGGLNMTATHPIVKVLAASMAVAIGDNNYIEMEMVNPNDMHRYRITLQHQSRPTPHELRRKAEIERDEAREQCNQAKLEQEPLRSEIESLNARLAARSSSAPALTHKDVAHLFDVIEDSGVALRSEVWRKLDGIAKLDAEAERSATTDTNSKEKP